LRLDTSCWSCGHYSLYPKERRYRVLEIKTSGATTIHEAMYKNSDQATGYSVMLDSIAADKEETTTFEVFYLVFASTLDTLENFFEFTKSRSGRAGWINTIIT